MKRNLLFLILAIAGVLRSEDIVLYSTLPPSQSATTVCTNVWTRPTCWPVGAGYTVETWTTPETNLLKWVTCGSSSENIMLQTVSAIPYFVDWYADGTHVSNYNNLALATFAYPDDMRDRYIPVKAGYTNGAVPVLYFSGVSQYATNATLDKKTAKTVEAVFDCRTGSLSGSMFQYWMELEFVRGNALLLYGNTCYMSGLRKAEFPLCKTLGPQAFYACYQLREAYFPAVTSVLASAFAQCYSLRGVDMPECQNLGYGAFNACRRMSALTPMPNLKTVGTEVFRGCNLSYPVMTNFVLALGSSGSAYQTLDFRDNPGTPELMSWYVSGSVSNDLAASGWNIKF